MDIIYLYKIKRIVNVKQKWSININALRVQKLHLHLIKSTKNISSAYLFNMWKHTFNKYISEPMGVM